ncbi:MAG: Eco57I restriction-modification methylase domain-containing protein [Raineya sp.]|jgi:hypothetical protein|nr:Eco57I restriction-modification methylase domain-containing protein [Raineya sp.]
MMPYIENNFFNREYLATELPKIFDNHVSDPVFSVFKTLYNKTKFEKLNEAQLEEEFIKPALQALGYAYAYQIQKKAFGKNHKPDFALFADDLLKNNHYNAEKDDTADILALCESKAYDITLDTGKISEKENPHFQIIRYLNDLKINFGFLTNGRLWRFYETSKNRAEKVFFEIDLEKIIEDDNLQYFNYFYFIFRKDAFTTTDKASISVLLKQNEEAKLAVEKDLKEVIYGSDSIVEQIGQALYKQYGKSYSLADIYHHSVTFAFRLIFIGYFEDKFKDILFEQHPFYKQYSLHQLIGLLKENKNDFPDEKYNGWGKLKDLFRILDEGREDDDIPLLNGGLFAQEKAPLLAKSRLLNNQELLGILNKLFELKTNEQRSYFTRDFKTLSIQHIGNIYEGLLEFDFKAVLDESQYYVTYEEKGKIVDAQLDVTDYEELRRDKTKNIVDFKKYSKGEIYFSNKSNSRKTTASYYTPTSFTEFMAKSALQKALATESQILNLRILDNACGSGHFLHEILNQVTQYAYEHIEEQTDLALSLQTEKALITKNVERYLGENVQIDELVLLKRLLLKKIIFGIDLNPFAVELTRLSLWLDTFILGTPLSFIEHHIKQGNALIGSKIQALYQKLTEKSVLARERIEEELNSLTSRLERLSDLKDTTTEEIKASKEIYRDLQIPLKKLKKVLDFLAYEEFIPFEYTDKETRAEKMKQINGSYERFMADILEGERLELLEEINTISEKYHFFHYEIEFAEIFQKNPKGFHCIIGNPPWDVVEFSENDFFPQYRSSYRTLKQSEKEKVRKEVLEYAHVQKAYNEQKDQIEKANSFYKLQFPLCEGGKSNIFRFFIEKNLSLLSDKGSLTYLTPSAWIYEDGSTKLRKHILEKFQIDFFYQFENREKIFERVDSRYKFATFQISAPSLQVTKQSIPVRFMQTEAFVLKTNKNIIEYSYTDIETLSKEHHSFMEVKTTQDLEILRKIYGKFSAINPDEINFKNELNATSDKDLFIETPQADLMPLYEGKMIHQYNSRFAEPQYWVNEKALEQRLQSVEISRLVDDIYEQIDIAFKAEKKSLGKQKAVLTYLGLSKDTELLPFVVFDKTYPRLVFRDVASNTNERSFISAVVPHSVTYAHTLQGSFFRKYVLKENKQVGIKPFNIKKLFFVNGVFNSMVLDYTIRFIIDMHVSKSYVMRLPMPLYDEGNEIHEQIVRNSALLNIYNNSEAFIKEFKNLGIKESEIPTSVKSYDKLRIENDILVAGLYGISKAEMQHICSEAYFKVLNDKNPAYVAVLLDKM